MSTSVIHPNSDTYCIYILCTFTASDKHCIAPPVEHLRIIIKYYVQGNGIMSKSVNSLISVSRTVLLR